MSKRNLIAGMIALSVGISGAVHAQSTTPPERMNGSSTTDNPATAATPQPGSPAAMSSPSTTGATTAPALGTPTGAARGAAHSDATPDSPVAGANSFTEGQARSRIEDNGFAQISDLKLDDQGIWRAKATKDGKSVTVALDFRGNVVAQ